jgi:DNA-binding response OmpR family regulator
MAKSVKSDGFFSSPKERPTANDSHAAEADVALFDFAGEQADRRFEYLVRQRPVGGSGSLRELVANTRFLTIGAGLKPPLMEFVQAAFGPVTIYSLEQDNIRGFSSQPASFSIIVALLDDVIRAKRVFREHKSFMDNKLCYAIMTDSNPRARASLLRFAFDDVFDTRTKPAEMIFRMQAHLNRQVHYNRAIKEDEHFQIFCDQNIEGRAYTTQMEILRKLYDNLGEVVRYRELASYDFHSGDFRYKSLSVRVHNLRKRLKNFEIRCERGTGYAMVKCES